MNALDPRGGRAWTPEDPGKPLQFGSDPYAARRGGSAIGQQIQTVLAEVLCHLEARTPLVVVSGAPGTGKSWLLDKISNACSAKNIAVCREDRADLVDPILADACDVLLVDEADSVAPGVLEQLMEVGLRKKRRTVVLMCLPGSVSRFDRVGRYPLLVQLLPLSEQEAYEFLESGAKSIGRAGLFTPEAARLVIERSAGSPRILRRNASLAYFAAASDGQPQITAEQVSQALEANNFAPLGKNPNEGKSWTKADPGNHSALYQNAPPPAAVESRIPTEKAAPAVPAEIRATPRHAVSAPPAPPAAEQPEQKRESRKLSDYALYASQANDYEGALERLRIERNAQELEKMKRRESNRVFYHSWRFGK